MFHRVYLHVGGRDRVILLYRKLRYLDIYRWHGMSDGDIANFSLNNLVAIKQSSVLIGTPVDTGSSNG